MVLKGEWDFASKRWEKNRDFQTQRLAHAKAQGYAAPGEYPHAFVLAEARRVHGEWRELS